GGWLGSGDWSNTGESFKSANDEFIIHHSSFMIAARPNPFNASTAISFELRAASFVNLAIYDISGRRVATLVDGWREAGVHEVTFDGSSLPSGIYIARLEAGGQTQVQKMVLMR
ncbi:MAG TPA: T9SS type A sorting domain-containing protein, partial [bacterium]